MGRPMGRCAPRRLPPFDAPHADGLRLAPLDPLFASQLREDASVSRTDGNGWRGGWMEKRRAIRSAFSYRGEHLNTT